MLFLYITFYTIKNSNILFYGNSNFCPIHFNRAFKHETKIRACGPGPAYLCPLKVYKKKSPAYSMKFRRPIIGFKNQSPGPAYFCDSKLIKRNSPKFSFGLKHSLCSRVPMTEDDVE